MKYLILILVLFAPVTWADCGHGNNPCDIPVPGPQGPQGEPGPQGEQGLQGAEGSAGAAGVAGIDAQGSVSDDKFDTGIASMIALSNIDFSSSTKAWQVGLAVGTYDGEQAMAFGAGKLLTKYDMLFKASGTVANDEYGVGVGLMWKIQ